MATKRTKPVDYVAYEPALLALSKARAAQHLLDFLDNAPGHSGSLVTFRAVERAEHEYLPWIRQFAQDALTAALDEAEQEYRKARAPEGPHVVGWSPGAVFGDAWLRRQIEGLDRGGES